MAINHYISWDSSYVTLLDVVPLTFDFALALLLFFLFLSLPKWNEYANSIIITLL